MKTTIVLLFLFAVNISYVLAGSCLTNPNNSSFTVSLQLIHQNIINYPVSIYLYCRLVQKPRNALITWPIRAVKQITLKGSVFQTTVADAFLVIIKY